MKNYLIFWVLFAVLFSACDDDNESFVFSDTGTVYDYGGAENCEMIIELDNGDKIQPLYYPSGFLFSNGQRVLVEYTELNNVTSGCDLGTPCEISYVEELSCAAYIDLYSENYDSLAQDSIYLHDAFMDGDCLYLKLSYPGGCEEHSVNLARIHPDSTYNSYEPAFEIRHDSNNDLCETWITQEFRFDVSTLKDEGYSEFALNAKLLDGQYFHKIFELN